MIIKVSVFDSYTYSALYDKGFRIYTELSGNPNFETTTPTLAELKTALDNYQVAMERATDSSLHNRIVRDNRRTDLVACLKQLAKYLDFVSNSSRELLSTTGYELVKDTRDSKPMTKVEGLKVSSLGNGILSVSFKRVPAAKSYVIEYREAGTESWSVQTTTVTKNILGNLKPFVEHQIRVYGVGKDKVVLYSDIVSV
jgi:hypothetical protein